MHLAPVGSAGKLVHYRFYAVEVAIELCTPGHMHGDESGGSTRGHAQRDVVTRNKAHFDRETHTQPFVVNEVSNSQ